MSAAIQILVEMFRWLMDGNDYILKAFIADGVAMTLFYRIFFGKWWWNALPKKDQKAWEFGLTSDGWFFNGKGSNPVDTIFKLLDEVFNAKKHRPVEDELKNQIDELVKSNIKESAKERAMKYIEEHQSDFDKIIKDLVDTSISNAKSKDSEKK